MSEEGLAYQSEAGDMALSFAAATGKGELAEAMLIENEDLATTRGGGGMLPVHMAAYLGHKDMARFLYGKTRKRLITDHDRKDLLVVLINGDMYGKPSLFVHKPL